MTPCGQSAMAESSGMKRCAARKGILTCELEAGHAGDHVATVRTWFTVDEDDGEGALPDPVPASEGR